MSGEQQMQGRLVAWEHLVTTAALSSCAMSLVVPWAGYGFSAIYSTNAPRRKASIPRSRPERKPMSRMDARHSVSIRTR